MSPASLTILSIFAQSLEAHATYEDLRVLRPSNGAAFKLTSSPMFSKFTLFTAS